MMLDGVRFGGCGRFAGAGCDVGGRGGGVMPEVALPPLPGTLVVWGLDLS
jgi:hypothetical protein